MLIPPFLTAQSNQHQQKILPYNQVEIPPIHPDCDSTSICSINKIAAFLNKNFDEQLFGEYQPLLNFKIKFIIDEKGKVAWAKAFSESPEIAAEAERLIKNLPAFTPGKNNGNPIAVAYLMPISVKYFHSFPNAYDLKDVDKLPSYEDCDTQNNSFKCLYDKLSLYITEHLDPGDLPAGTHAASLSIEYDENGKLLRYQVKATSEKMHKETVKMMQHFPEFENGAIVEGEKVHFSIDLPISISVNDY